MYDFNIKWILKTVAADRSHRWSTGVTPIIEGIHHIFKSGGRSALRKDRTFHKPPYILAVYLWQEVADLGRDVR